MSFQAYLKGNIPCHQWTLQILLLKSHWWNKNDTKHGYQLWTNIDYFSVYFFKAYGTFVVHIKLKRWMPLTRKFLDFSYKIIVLHKYMYVITIFSLLCFVWWLPLTGLSWIPYMFGCATCLETPSSSGTIPNAHICCWWV